MNSVVTLKVKTWHMCSELYGTGLTFSIKVRGSNAFKKHDLRRKEAERWLITT